MKELIVNKDCDNLISALDQKLYDSVYDQVTTAWQQAEYELLVRNSQNAKVF